MADPRYTGFCEITDHDVLELHCSFLFLHENICFVYFLEAPHQYNLLLNIVGWSHDINCKCSNQPYM